MKTVYILGAGASKAVWGFPTMSNFLAESVGLIGAGQGNGERYARLWEYLCQRFGGLDGANLEEVLADLDETLHGLGSTLHPGEAHAAAATALSARAELLQLIAERLLSQVKEHEKADAYDRVLGRFERGDALITLNYDVGIETFVELLKSQNATDKPLVRGHDHTTQLLRGAFLQYEVENPVDWLLNLDLLLKLHGSIDYFRCRNRACSSSRRVSKFSQYQDCSERLCHECGSTLERYIIPPTLRKTFEDCPAMSLLWRVAREALMRAERLVVGA